ncbi:MAG: hypothetical protein JST22_17615 [Bacteroidetes bacterium]|nr:hypothetical protein [Bacteroidota bacterium]
MRTTLSLVAASFVVGLGALQAQPEVVVDHAHDARVFEVNSGATRKQGATQDSSAKLATIRDAVKHSEGSTRGMNCTLVRYPRSGEAVSVAPGADGTGPSSGAAQPGAEISPGASQGTTSVAEPVPHVSASPEPVIGRAGNSDTRLDSQMPTLE